MMALTFALWFFFWTVISIVGWWCWAAHNDGEAS